MLFNIEGYGEFFSGIAPEIDRMTCSACIQYASSDRMMVTLVMMMFHVKTILTFFRRYNVFK